MFINVSVHSYSMIFSEFSDISKLLITYLTIYFHLRISAQNFFISAILEIINNFKHNIFPCHRPQALV